MSKQNVTYKKRQMITAMEQNLCIVTKAAFEVGITRKTHYDWMRKDKKYKEAVDELQNATLDHVESKLHELIDDLNVPSVLFYMKTKGKQRGYIERSEIAVEGSVESKVIEWTPAKEK
tara:strand:- start:2531 stop:2884 length:354 start_codon:yes stop_codon:yes gene_type:complete